MVRLRSSLACVGALVGAAQLCAADSFPSDTERREPPTVDPYSYAWSDPRMVSTIGVGVTVGAGITGFTSDMRDFIDRTVGVVWNVRFAIGTHIPVGLELGYMGSVAKLQTFANDYNGLLLGTTFEAALRWTILPHARGTPFIFAGAGWERFDVRDVQFAEADTGLSASDSVAEFPMGAGLAYRGSDGWVADLRATFRPTTTTSLLFEPGSEVHLDSWEASGLVGYEF